MMKKIIDDEYLIEMNGVFLTRKVQPGCLLVFDAKNYIDKVKSTGNYFVQSDSNSYAVGKVVSIKKGTLKNYYIVYDTIRVFMGNNIFIWVNIADVAAVINF